MQKNLVIVESPAKAKTIEKFLGEDFKVMSSYGHIRDLKKKNFGVDLETFKPEYEIPDDKKNVVKELRAQARKSEAVWLASDEDREGEAISWHLAEVLKINPQESKRIVFHEITKPAILDAIAHPRHIDLNLVDAQQARRVLDRLVGFKLSPVLWRRVRPSLSAGRVQSVAVRLIVEREREIEAFQSEASYRVTAVFTLPESGKTLRAELSKRFPTEEAAAAFLEQCKTATFTIKAVNTRPAKRTPAPPFTTSTLQQEAARKLGFPVAMTMRVAQALYEAGLITYMRTDSMNLSDLCLNACGPVITEKMGAEYHQRRHYHTHAKGAQEAHEAIRPTDMRRETISGSSQEKRLYDLIWKRTIACQMADAQMEKTTVNIDVASASLNINSSSNECFVANGEVIKFEGFLKVYRESQENDGDLEEDTSILPPVKEGETLTAQEVTASERFTQQPPRYTEASLVHKMEELGIGRPSTYAPTITTLTTGRGYIVKGDKDGIKKPVCNLSLRGGKVTESHKTEVVGAEKGKLMPQEIGMIVTDFLERKFPSIMDYDFTANVEKDFDSIADGKTVWNSVISRFYGPFHERVDETLKDGEYDHRERVLGTDPSDGKTITAKFGQYGAYVQKGEGDDKQYASLAKGQLIENITLEEALALFSLPRTVGEYEGIAVVTMKGRFGPYLKYGDKNISLPRGVDPLSVSLDECVALIRKANEEKDSAKAVISAFPASDISVLQGRYGPYIKHAGGNYKIPKGTDASSLTEEDCKSIIAAGKPTGTGYRRTKTKK